MVTYWCNKINMTVTKCLDKSLFGNLFGATGLGMKAFTRTGRRERGTERGREGEGVGGGGGEEQNTP